MQTPRRVTTALFALALLLGAAGALNAAGGGGGGSPSPSPAAPSNNAGLKPSPSAGDDSLSVSEAVPVSNPTQCAGTAFLAELSPANLVAPNSTTAAPLNASLVPARGSLGVCLAPDAANATWSLQLCDVTVYFASHLHIGSPSQDYPPPFLPLEPKGPIPDPFAPALQLPALSPPVTVTGCSYTATGSLAPGDVIALPGNPATAVPPASSWADFTRLLAAGQVYANVHTRSYPGGIMRGNLVGAGAGSGSSSSRDSGARNTNSAGGSAGGSQGPTTLGQRSAGPDSATGAGGSTDNPTGPTVRGAAAASGPGAGGRRRLLQG